jgi:hypothetical protein
VRGLRHILRNFTAQAVKEHLRSQVDRRAGAGPLTPTEVHLVRFAAERSAELGKLADRSSAE